MNQNINRVDRLYSHQSSDDSAASDVDCLRLIQKLHEDTFGVDSEFAKNKKRHE